MSFVLIRKNNGSRTPCCVALVLVDKTSDGPPLDLFIVITPQTPPLSPPSTVPSAYLSHSPYRTPSHFPPIKTSTKMCTRTTTVYTRCTHVVRDQVKCEAAKAFSEKSSPPRDHWCKKESRFVLNESCRPCRKKSMATSKARALKHREKGNEYRRAQGCVVM